MLVDAFLYHGERNVLEIRLAELQVDRHLVIEGDRTMQGVEYEPMFDPAEYPDHKFDHVVFPLPANATPKKREEALRNLAGQYCRFAYPGATVLFSDVDEIPRHSDVTECGEPVRLWSERHFYWTLDWQLVGGIYDCAPFLALAEDITDAQAFRKGVGVGEDRTSGWEFSFLGDLDFVLQKYRDFSHEELNRPEILADAARRMAQGLDPSPLRNLPLVPVEIDDTWPLFVQENRAWVEERRLSRTVS